MTGYLMQFNTDEEKVQHWQRTQDPTVYTELTTRFRPIIASVVNKYKNLGVAPAVLRAQASSQMIKAFKSYRPEHGTQLSTHVWNGLQKVQRVAMESLQSGHIPEFRNLKKATFTTAKFNLQDRLGREPNVEELSDELSWSKKETSRMNAELGSEATASRAKFDFYGNSTTSENKDKALVDYLYHEASNPDKIILEHTFGMGGKPILSGKEIAKKLNINEMSLRRRKDKLAATIESYK